VARLKATVKRILKCQNATESTLNASWMPAVKERRMSNQFRTCRSAWKTNAEPFDTSSPTLRSLQSGLAASPELDHDFDTAFADGQYQV
jgi:hypothetical protein